MLLFAVDFPNVFDGWEEMFASQLFSPVGFKDFPTTSSSAEDCWCRSGVGCVQRKDALGLSNPALGLPQSCTSGIESCTLETPFLHSGSGESCTPAPACENSKPCSNASFARRSGSRLNLRRAVPCSLVLSFLPSSDSRTTQPITCRAWST